MQVRESITGAELRELVVAKFGRSYDTRLCQRRDRFNKLKMARRQTLRSSLRTAG